MTTKRGETAAIVPSETKGRETPDDRRRVHTGVSVEVRKLLDAGLSVIDPSSGTGYGACRYASRRRDRRGGGWVSRRARRAVTRYRVRVDSYVVVEARNVVEAKARAEIALRQAVAADYRTDVHGRWGEGWHLFGWQSKKAERVNDDDE